MTSAFIAAIFLVVCFLIRVSQGIVNGSRPDDDHFRSTVSLQWDARHKCGGVLLNANTVLTVAHCYTLTWLNKSEPHRVSVLLGSRNLIRPDQFSIRISVRKTIFPDNFSSVMKTRAIMRTKLRNVPNDYLLLKLSKEVRPSTGIQFALLPSGEMRPSPGDQCYVYGWGRYRLPDAENKTAETFSDNLLKGVMKITTQRDCWLSRPPVETMMCATQVFHRGRGLGMTCFGDSGGPILCPTTDGSFYLAGLVEAGSVPCNKGLGANVFMRVWSVIDWIRKHLSS